VPPHDGSPALRKSNKINQEDQTPKPSALRKNLKYTPQTRKISPIHKKSPEPKTKPALRKKKTSSPPTPRIKPAIRKTPKEPEVDPAFGKNRQVASEHTKRFTVGAAPAIVTPVQGGLVKEAKRILEDRIRKTRRQEKICELRPMISTPNMKRSRDHDGVWDTPDTPARTASTRRTPATPGRKVQTPIINFLLKQAKEEPTIIQLEETKIEMSSSSNYDGPSIVPQAAPRVKAGAKKMLQLKPSKVTSILQYFESSRDVPKSSKVIVRKNSCYNNSALCLPQLGRTDTYSDRAGQQMAPQPNFAEQPITDPAASHVTGFQTSPPITSSQARPAENPEKSSHL
jgi:hypothetical protein